ncbi:MAG: DUF456 domain-containing protein [Acidimicrobiales bacterium]
MDGVVVLVALAMAVGIAGTLVPLLPGLALVWVAGLVYGLVEGFGAVGVAAFTVMTLLAAAGVAAGWVLPQRAAGKAGAARSSVWLGAVAAIVGFFVIPVVGVAVGGLLGLYAGEWRRTGDPATAWRATRATLVGFGLASLVQFAAGVVMALLWVAWALAG